jgi:hypothetical protein
MDRLRTLLFEASVIFLSGVTIAVVIVAVSNMLHKPSVETFIREYDAVRYGNQQPVADKYIQLFPVQDLLSAIDARYKNDICHVEGHAIGRSIYKRDQNFAAGIKQCGNSCTFGCFHGVLMEMFQTDSDTFGGTIEDESPEMLLEHVRSVASSLCTRPEVEAVIQRRACYHGLGHVFETMSNNDISSGVTSCEVFSSAHAKEACVTGVFMEYLFNASSTPLRITKGQEPCSAFPEYTNQCYIYKAYGWIRAWGSVDAALKACTTFGEHELLCIRNVARAATTEEILASEDKINAQCGGLSGPDHDECIKGTLLKTIFLNDGDDSDHACDGVTEAYRPACVRELHSFLENTI